MNKLEIISKIFSAYISQKIQLHETRFSEAQEDTIFTLCSVSKNRFQVEETKLWYDFEAYHDGESIDKLILKSTDEIADEDALEVATKICGWGYLTVESMIFQVREELLKGFYNRQTNLPGRAWFEIYQFLQLKGYDVPQYLLKRKNMKEALMAIYK